MKGFSILECVLAVGIFASIGMMAITQHNHKVDAFKQSETRWVALKSQAVNDEQRALVAWLKAECGHEFGLDTISTEANEKVCIRKHALRAWTEDPSRRQSLSGIGLEPLNLVDAEIGPN